MNGVEKIMKEHPKLSLGVGIGIVVIIIGVVVYKEVKKNQEFKAASQLEIKQASTTPIPIACNPTVTPACNSACESWLSKYTWGIL